MTHEELRETVGSAIKMASDNGAMLVTSLLKAAQEAPAAAQTPQGAPPVAPKATTLADRYGEKIDIPLYDWGERTLGPGMGNYVATGTGMAGLGALYGLLFGDKKHGTLDSILHNALLFGGAGLGGQYLKNTLA